MVDNVFINKLKSYNPVTKDDYINALKEMIQETTLSILSKTDFFDYVAFCGGTALRIFYGLPRASEDLDFSLINNPNNNFNIANYFYELNKTFSSYGFSFDIINNDNDSVIKSAFLKGNTLYNLIVIGLPDELKTMINNNENIRIKFEIDTSPPLGFETEYKYGYFPMPYKVKLLNKESLFAGKLHAIIYRTWNNRVKGRDYYDLIFYVSNNVKPNIEMLKNALIQTKNIQENDLFDNNTIKKMLIDKINSIDINLAIRDVEKFIKNKNELSIWSTEFFEDVINKIF